VTDDRPLPPGLHRETLAVRSALPRSQYGENAEALFLTSSFVQPDAETSARRFAGTEEGFTYTRTSNPTVASFEQRLAALEGTEAAIGASSGMGAILMLCMGLLKAGDHVVCSRSVFGSTLNLIGREFGKFGVETTFVSQTDVAEWKAALRPDTRLLFAETPTNPLTDVCDIRALADIAHDAGALLVVDNCFCTPALQRPTEYGADLVIHSGTKYLDGQGRVLAAPSAARRGSSTTCSAPWCAPPAWRCRPSTRGWCSRAWKRWASACRRTAPTRSRWRSGCRTSPG